jgi:predicted RNA binding protein YcfA (HicA-like mRNA interferase family)
MINQRAWSLARRLRDYWHCLWQHSAVAESLTLTKIVDTLVDLDVVDLDGVGPWPGEPDDADVYEPDWAQVHPNQSDATDMPMNMSRIDSALFNEVRTRASGGFNVPPPDVLDALAWYTPIHYFGMGAAIYIRESAVVTVAVSIMSGLDPVEREDWFNVMGSLRAAMSVLYLHEAFHHKIESLAIRFEVIERERRYLPYDDNVVIPLLKQRSDDVMEEALACAEMYRRFSGEAVYRKGVSDTVRKATLRMLPLWFQTLPPSYNQAGKFLKDTNFDLALAGLMSQVQEATTTPKRDATQWDLAPHQIRGLFNCQNITHVLVPLGQQPILPWIGNVRPLPSISTQKAVQHLQRNGWRIVPSRGKGSHIWLEPVGGGRPVNLPANRERLAPGRLKDIATAMGIRVADLRV